MSYDPSDVWLKDLQSTHGLVDVDDMEMDHANARIALSQTIPSRFQGQRSRTYPLVIEVDTSTGNIVDDGGPQSAPNTAVESIDETEQMVEVSLDATMPGFPNGPEWGNDGVQSTLFYSATTGAPGSRVPQVQINRRTNDAYFGWVERPSLVFSDDVGATGYLSDRYLFNATYSRPGEELLDQVVYYVKVPQGADWLQLLMDAQGAEVCWAKARRGGDPSNDRQILTVSNLQNPLSSPVRPIPSVYAVFLANAQVDSTTGAQDITLEWRDLHPSRQPTRVIHRYPGSSIQWQTLMGLGACRWQAHDDLGAGGKGHAFILYAYFAAGPLGNGAHPVGHSTRGWCDSFLVYFNGPLGGTLAPQTRSFVTDSPSPLHVSQAWRFIPTQPELDFPGRGLRFFLDDENFVANNGKPMAVFPFGAVAAPNRSNPLDPTDPFYSQPAEVYRMSLVGPDPSPHGVHDPDWPIQEVEPRRQMLMTRPPGYMDPEVQRVDAEPLSMQTTPSTRSTFVYYTTPTTIGGRGLRHRMRRALAE